MGRLAVGLGGLLAPVGLLDIALPLSTTASARSSQTLQKLSKSIAADNLLAHMVENSGVLSTLGSELKGISSDVLEVGFVGVQRTSISPSTPVQPLKVTIGSGDTSSMLYGVRGGGWLMEISSDILTVGFIGVQRTSISPSTPVQPLKATVSSGDTLSMLYGVGGGLKGISCDILTAGLVGAQRMSISPSTPVQPLKATVG